MFRANPNGSGSRLVPHFTMKGVKRNPVYERLADAERMIEGLRKDGVPE